MYARHARRCRVCRYVARRVVAIVAATSSGVPRGEWDLRVKLSAAKRMIDRAGMGVSVWGHASVRCPQDASRMLIAPFGESFSHATASGLESRPLHPGALDAAEAAATNVTAVVLHGAVYAARPDARCVLHTHSPHCTAVAAADLRLDAAITQDAMQFLGRVAYHDFQGVADEAEEMAAVAEAARGADALFLRNHGVIIVGEDVERAYSRLFYLERCCQTQLLVSVRRSLLCQQTFARAQCVNSGQADVLLTLCCVRERVCSSADGRAVRTQRCVCSTRLRCV